MEGEMDIILHHVQHVFIEHVLADVEHVRTVRRTCSYTHCSMNPRCD